MDEWKDETNIDRLRNGLQEIVDKTGAAIKAADPDGHLNFLSEGLDDYLQPYTQKVWLDALEENPDITTEEFMDKINVTIGPLVKQFTLDKMNGMLLNDGYYDPVNKILQTRFPPDSEVESVQFAYVADDRGEEHFGLRYKYKDGSYMFFGEEVLEDINQLIISKGGMNGYGENAASAEAPE